MQPPTPPHLESYVDRGWITAADARAVMAYAGDVEASASHFARGDRRAAFRREAEGYSPALERKEEGYRQTSAEARKRADDARRLMGRDQAAVMHQVGVRGLDIVEVAADLGWPFDDVRVLFCRAARLLLQVYREHAWAA